MFMKRLFLFNCILFLAFLQLSGQSNVGVGTTTPDPSSILDVQSSSQGILVPRMTSAHKSAIPSPATGLLDKNNIGQHHNL